MDSMVYLVRESLIMTTDAFGWYTDKLSKSPTNSKEAESVHMVQKLEGLDIFESITKNRFKCIHII